MSRRRKLLEGYVEGWRSMNSELVLSTLADGFTFDDPALAEPVTKAAMAAYMSSWNDRAKTLSGAWRYENSHEVVEDRDGALLRWKWWRFTGTDIEGTALTKTTDDGMQYERITYYPNMPTWAGEGPGDGSRTLRPGPAGASFPQPGKGVVVGDAAAHWQAWETGSARACGPRYKTFFDAGSTPTNGLIQGLLEYPPGTRGLAHRHTPVETYYVLSGTGIGRIGDAALPIGPGDAVFVPSNMVHAFENSGGDILRVLWTLDCDRVDDIDFTYVA